jgi:organic radical activating enzyme
MNNEFDIHVLIETNKSLSQWHDDFIDWLDSRDEDFSMIYVKNTKNE